MTSPWYKLSGCPEVRQIILGHLFSNLHVSWQPPWGYPANDHDAPHVDLLCVSRSFVSPEEVYRALFSNATIVLGDWHLKSPADQGMTHSQSRLVRSLNIDYSTRHPLTRSLYPRYIQDKIDYLPNLKFVTVVCRAYDAVCVEVLVAHMKQMAVTAEPASEAGQRPTDEAGSCKICNDFRDRWEEEIGNLEDIEDWADDSSLDWPLVFDLMRASKHFNLEIRLEWFVRYFGDQTRVDGNINLKSLISFCQMRVKADCLFQESVKMLMRRDLNTLNG